MNSFLKFNESVLDISMIYRRSNEQYKQTHLIERENNFIFLWKIGHAKGWKDVVE